MGLGLVPLHARNDVFARLRLVISRRFRLVGSTTRILPHPLSAGLAQRTRTTGYNGHDIALQFAIRTPRIFSPGKTRQKFSSRTTRYLLIALTSRSHRLNFINARRKPRRVRGLFRRSAKCFALRELRNETLNVMARYNVRSGRRCQRRLVRGRGLISVHIALSTFSNAKTVTRTRTSKRHVL